MKVFIDDHVEQSGVAIERRQESWFLEEKGHEFVFY